MDATESAKAEQEKSSRAANEGQAKKNPSALAIAIIGPLVVGLIGWIGAKVYNDYWNKKTEQWRVYYTSGPNRDTFREFWIPARDGQTSFGTSIEFSGPGQNGLAPVSTHVTVGRKGNNVTICSQVDDPANGKPYQRSCTDALPIGSDGTFKGLLAGAHPIFGERVITP